MASRAFVKVMAALTMCTFIAEYILSEVPDLRETQKLRRTSQKITKFARSTRNLWPLCTPEDLRQTETFIYKLGKDLIPGKQTMVAATAFALGMLVDMEPRLKGQRHQAITQLIDLVETLNSIFDKQLEQTIDYQFASQALDQWYDVLEKGVSNLPEVPR